MAATATAITCLGFLFAFECDLPPAPPAIVACPQVQTWSKDYQARLQGELRQLAPGSALEESVREHIQLRDQIRKCRQKRTAPSGR